jgi:hypothetical protein
MGQKGIGFYLYKLETKEVTNCSVYFLSFRHSKVIRRYSLLNHSADYKTVIQVRDEEVSKLQRESGMLMKT